jgi:hypothetical protein
VKVCWALSILLMSDDLYSHRDFRWAGAGVWPIN